MAHWIRQNDSNAQASEKAFDLDKLTILREMNFDDFSWLIVEPGGAAELGLTKRLFRRILKRNAF